MATGPILISQKGPLPMRKSRNFKEQGSHSCFQPWAMQSLKPLLAIGIVLDEIACVKDCIRYKNFSVVGMQIKFRLLSLNPMSKASFVLVTDTYIMFTGSMIFFLLQANHFDAFNALCVNHFAFYKKIIINLSCGLLKNYQLMRKLI